MAIDLMTWVPKYLITELDELGGTVITNEHWNELWNLSRAQGDDTTGAVKQILDTLNATAWHPTSAATYISNPTLPTGLSTNVGGQIIELHDYITDLYEATDAHALRLTDLDSRIDALSVGAISAFNHNEISNRNAADAHPISAITGLQTALDAKPTTHAALADRNNTASHNTSAIEFASGVSLTQKLASIDATIASITGDVSEITHADLLGSDAANSHPISAITSLTASLSNINLGITNLNTAVGLKQNKITASTNAPSGGGDGDVWIQYV